MLLSAPHHDGSERHVSDLEPALGDTVTVWLRVPHAAAADEVWVRTTPDAEPRFAAARVDRSTPWETWWRAELVLHNPVTNYRFLLAGGTAGYRFVNAAGVHERTVGDTFDFRISAWPGPPAWVADAAFYQVFPDRFARSGPPPAAPSWAHPAEWEDPVEQGPGAVYQWFGGDLGGVEAHLDHVQSLGLDGLYVTPFFPAPSSHRYDADSFRHVDPLLGGDDALIALVKACHNRGIRVLGDLTVNHSGRGHEWFRTARADADSSEAGFYFFRRHPDDYEAWYDVPSLPKLDLRNPDLRGRLVSGPESVTATFLRPPFDLDGWRVDVANMAGRNRGIDVNHDVAVAMRHTMAAARPDAYLVAEHCYDASRDLDGDGWHGVMNYLSFLRPVWTWLRDPAADGVPFLGDPVPIPRLGGAATVRSMVETTASQPWRSTVSGFNLLGSHDTSRFRSVCGDADRHVAGAGLLFGLPGVPMVFAGDELGLEGVGGDGARRPMPWGREPDPDVLTAYRQLGATRRSSSALRRGGLRWVHAGDDVLVFLRESCDQRMLVQVARAEHAPVVIPAAALDGTPGERRFGRGDASRRADLVELPAAGAGTHIWELE
jgi:alpha-glucosidase